MECGQLGPVPPQRCPSGPSTLGQGPRPQKWASWFNTSPRPRCQPLLHRCSPPLSACPAVDRATPLLVHWPGTELEAGELSYKGCIKPKPQPHMNLKRFPEAPGERGKAVGFAYTWGTDGQWSLQLWQKLWPRQLVQSKGRAQRKVGVQTAPCYLPQAGV